MTSTTGQDPSPHEDAHPDVMDISDLAEGILPTERATDVQAHVESCAQCGDVIASLREIRDLLGDLPEPEPMPADIAARIDTALAAESRLDSTLPHVPRETSLPAQSSNTTADVPRGTSAPAGRPSASTGPGRGSRRRRALLMGTASIAALLALGGMVYELASHSGTSSMNADSSAERKAGAEDRGSSSAVEDQVARLLDGTGGKSAGGGITSPMLSGKGDARVAAPDGSVVTVPACVLQATQRTEKPLAADREAYQGLDSYLVVLPDPADTTRVDAFVVTASCTADTPGQVLFHDSYPRS
ncbi:anti-sigma factor family protein [Streptomyces sp. NPDC049040]|uniref:anti-sigma factor family protein n=1 Tax=Streptomyces sp. NPDC049040 TaxID=3365593 RepID=UPI003711E1AC